MPRRAGARRAGRSSSTASPTGCPPAACRATGPTAASRSANAEIEELWQARARRHADRDQALTCRQAFERKRNKLDLIRICSHPVPIESGESRHAPSRFRLCPRQRRRRPAAGGVDLRRPRACARRAARRMSRPPGSRCTTARRSPRCSKASRARSARSCCSIARRSMPRRWRRSPGSTCAPRVRARGWSLRPASPRSTTCSPVATSPRRRSSSIRRAPSGSSRSAARWRAVPGCGCAS